MSDPDEITSTRLFGVPRERLFGAFAEPEQLVAWWGPEGFTNTFHEFDFRPGGAWRFTMHGPDGTDHEIVKTFTGIDAPEKITFQHEGTAHRFRMEMTFSDEGGKGRLTWRMRFEEPGEAEQLRAFIATANEQNFDRLESHLNAPTP